MIDYEDHSNSKEQFISTEDSVNYEKLKQEILPYISKQQDTQIRDSFDNRWIKCKKCGAVGMDHKFCMYGGKGEVNLGVCYDCIRKKNKNCEVKASIGVGMSFYNKLLFYQPFMKAVCEGDIIFVEPKCEEREK